METGPGMSEKRGQMSHHVGLGSIREWGGGVEEEGVKNKVKLGGGDFFGGGDGSKIRLGTGINEGKGEKRLEGVWVP